MVFHSDVVSIVLKLSDNVSVLNETLEKYTDNSKTKIQVLTKIDCYPNRNVSRMKRFNSIQFSAISPKTTHICRIKGCGGAGCPPPPPIIFERLKLPQQIIYRRKENLSESPNHQKYWENILVSRFYEQFSRNRRNLGHFRNFEKISNS